MPKPCWSWLVTRTCSTWTTTGQSKYTPVSESKTHLMPIARHYIKKNAFQSNWSLPRTHSYTLWDLTDLIAAPMVYASFLPERFLDHCEVNGGWVNVTDRGSAEGVRALLRKLDMCVDDGKRLFLGLNPFTPNSDQFQNFSYSLTSKITSHSMENLAFHSLLRWKMIIMYQFSLPAHLYIALYKVGRINFWTWEWKG